MGIRKRLLPFSQKNKQSDDGIILTGTESIALNDNKTNKNTFVIGEAGTGKTRFYAMPNIMQMNSSYVVSDSNGLILANVGKLLVEKGNYKIKNFDLCNYKKSMHYNPFAYIDSEEDILRLVNTIISNTKGEGEKSGEDFWVKAERLLYTAFIGYIFYECPKSEQNFNTLINFIDRSEAKGDDNIKSPIDIMFEMLEEKKPNHFAVRQYKKYKLAAGETAKSILKSCAARLAVFEDKELQELMSYDELEFGTLANVTQKTALFITFPVCYDMTLITSMLYSQLFNVLNGIATYFPFFGSLPIPVHFILDDFPKIGTIPNFDKTIATLKSRNIWVSIMLQSIPEIKRIYKDDYKEILKYCDNMLYFGSVNNETQALVREYLGIKKRVDLRPMMCLVARKKTYSFSDPYDIAKHKFYRYISDTDKNNNFSIEKYIEEEHYGKQQKHMD